MRIALLIDEFFGEAGTAFGGYGFLAKNVICKYLATKDCKIDVLIQQGLNAKYKNRINKFLIKYFPKKIKYDENVNLYFLPTRKSACYNFFKKKNYDFYFSIELTNPSAEILKFEPDKSKKLLLWIQDPRPKSVWDNVINTMQVVKEPNFFSQETADMVKKFNDEGRLRLISQGYSLNPLALEYYGLPEDVKIDYVPNPIKIDFDFDLSKQEKKNSIIFLGRLETQKRAWLFCEVAKRMPQYEFNVMGKFFRNVDINKKMLEPYMDGSIKNLHFLGHLENEEKAKVIREAKILLNTSIWEGIPISWLEVLEKGTLIVSNLNNEDLPRKFGICTGDNLGDGFDNIDKYCDAIAKLIENDELRNKLANEAIQYIRERHSVDRFKRDITRAFNEVNNA